MIRISRKAGWLAFVLSYLPVFISCSQHTKLPGQIPLAAKHWYQLNNQGDQVTPSSGLQQLCDGVLDKEVFMGWGKILANYDCYYEFKDVANVRINKIRLYDGKGTFADKPFTLYAKASASAPRVLLATFTGDTYNQWVEIALPKPVPAQYLVVNTSGGFPTELELYGAHEAGKPGKAPPKKAVRFANELGLNSFVWEFMEHPNPNIRDKIYEPKMELMQAFTQYRDYVDWEKIETNEGKYAFNPTMAGGWNYDILYKRLKQEGKEVLVCLKTVPNWFLQANYPDGKRDSENVPAPYEADLLRPASYSQQAKLAFQFAARYGRNTKVSPALLGGVITGPIYATAPEAGSRVRETGLGYIHYMECDNERDKWWKGRKAYQTAREYAANLSAFYDGHKNTLGPGVGVKNADPTMQVVVAGTASARTDYIRGIIDWCKEFRGYKPDGTVDLCFDVINYHCYANASGVSQSNQSARGAAPEVTQLGAFADDFVAIGREYNKEVWLTEAGYDINPQSPVHAPGIGSKTPLQVQADWILRTALLYARHGIDRLFFYQAYDLNPNNGIQFSSSGLLDGRTGRRRPAADYLYQVQQLMGNYVYKETISTNPLVDRYELKGKSIYALMMPTEEGKTGTYTLRVPGLSTVHTPKIGSKTMDTQPVKPSKGSIRLTVTETPIFVSVGGSN